MSSKNDKLLYILSFGNRITEPATTLNALELTQTEKTTVTDSDSKTYYVVLNGVKINKRIYQPCEIEAELDFTQTTTDESGNQTTSAPSFSAVSGLLLQRQVKVTVLDVPEGSTIDAAKKDNLIYPIADSYYVFELDPQLKRDTQGTKMYVKLNIFSMDKLMTLNEYSKAYVARKLGSGILKPESFSFGTISSDVPLIKTNHYSMRFLKYDEQDIISDAKGKKLVTTIPSEFIQPYLVQYNETFYDFLVRTANRCGEFLYFEDGALTLGLPDSGDPVTIDDYNTVTRQDISAPPLDIKGYARDSMKDGEGAEREFMMLNHTVIDKASTGYPEDGFAGAVSSNAELATDEYIFPLYRGKYTRLTRETNDDMPLYKLISAVKAATMGTDLVSSALSLAGDDACLLAKSVINDYSTNSTQREKQMLPYKGKSEQFNGDKVVQFGTLDKEGWTTLDYYNDIHAHEAEQQRGIICIDMGTGFVPVKLGQKIKVTGLSDTYVIIQIKQVSDVVWTRDYYTYGDTSSDKFSERRSQKIYAIPSYQEGNDLKFIPPVHPVPVIRKVGPQTAFVTDNNDPKYQGRVRVAFPWQSTDPAKQEALTAADNTLKTAREETQTAKEKKDKLTGKTTLLAKEINELLDYVNADEATRKQMMADLEKQISEQDDYIENLKLQKTEMEKQRDKYESKSNRAKIENKKIFYAHKKETAESSIKLLEKRIAAREKLKESLIQEKADMEAAAKEHDSKKNSADYKNPETDNTFIAAKKKEYEEAMKELEEASSTYEEDRKKEKFAEEERDGLKAEVEASIDTMSTPWIRVASPMATPGGGAYFKPRKGDEVLINFDCDNVERPYVVGSLYSKNSLDPFELYERKGSPAMEKSVSMTLMSPNGHHIAFCDPPKGDRFVYGVNPGLKFWGTLAPFTFMPNQRELAGGVRISDRYGIYEIEASTHDRNINIKSPIGTVNISAFTGITIDAPNGNINIRGKNVNIEARNKLTLTSGTNIKPEGIGHPDYYWGDSIWNGFKDWKSVLNSVAKGLAYPFLFLGHQALAAGPSTLNDMMGPAAFADLSLFRHMFEVAVKPVEGTMLIKSKRYLKLEAGRGNATIKGENFPKPDVKSREDFYYNMVETLNDFIAQIDNIFNQYLQEWEKTSEAKERFELVAKAFLKNPKDPDYTKEAFKQKDNDWDPTAIDNVDLNGKIKDGNVTYKGKTMIGTGKKRAFVWYAKDYSKAVHSFHKFVLDFPKMFDNYDANNDNPFKKAAKDAFGKVVDELVDKWKDKYGDNEPTDDFINWEEDLFTLPETKTLFKRKATAHYLIEVNNSQLNKDGKFLYIGFEESDIVDKKIKTDYNWKNFMTHFDHGLTFGNKWFIYLLDGIWEPIKKRWKNGKPWGVIGEKKLWAKQSGKILFSDSDGATFSFDGNGIKSETHSNVGNRDYLLKKLLSIK